MTEQELFDKIKQSAEDMKIPESLEPDQISRQLVNRSRYRLAAYQIAAIAAIFFLCGTAGLGFHLLQKPEAESPVMEAGQEDSADGSDYVQELPVEQEAEKKDKQNAGDMYVIAGSYDKVYDEVKEYEASIREEIIRYDTDSQWTDYSIQEEALTTGAEDSSKNIQNEAGGGQMIRNESADKESARYSETNLQTDGVDESDFVKTDGKYIYFVKNGDVQIIAADEGRLAKKGAITLSQASASDRILEMYVDGTVLNAIVQKEETSLQRESSQGALEDVYHFSSGTKTEILTYDISNPAQPKLTGSMEQDGYYVSSRKIDDIIYLFTERQTVIPDEPKNQAVAEDKVGGWIPLVDGKAVAADSIYLSGQSTQGLVISSLNVKKPDTVIDNVLIMNNYAQVYVSRNALYLYYDDYSQYAETKLAKFSLENGQMDAVGAASVRGTVTDTFALNESGDGNLRILTTARAGNADGNNLFIFDEKLKLAGSLEGIAPGEEIYAARYFGSTAYFVTYRNTDPLFAVDVSDAQNPKLLGELKITGFSEYLHMWGENKLAGIGYETDPVSGQRLGLKVTMFDISDPLNLKEIKSMVLSDVVYSEALYDYKCVLADAEENLLGFSVQTSNKGFEDGYLLFSWENGAFQELMSAALAKEADQTRGIYIDDTFYLIESDGISSFDRKKEYEFIEKLPL